ncbi:MAG: hypothetical protein HETSPECPRED_008820 [Heterodermia speciosa]|uniref:Uncharacterized protein n=1 Tax=Heterodermia speciosa TaxID=116794 RepID=A0A8H3EP90_9LECA|nr:MAG: hypothetical protein HETSPECPRED_008820 [Heterodermia speciosa]
MTAIARTARNVRPKVFTHQLRSESSSSASPNGSHISQAIVGGLCGGGLVFLGGYGYYHFSGAKTLINTAHEASASFNQYKEQLKKSTPEPNEALKWLRQTATSYVGFIPGGKSYVDSAFDDIDAIHQKHSTEVDQIVKDAYSDLKTVSEKGLSFESAQRSWEILQKHLKRLGELAGDSAQEIIDNHPTLKTKVGGNLDQLKQLGENYGPEAKKQVDETWDQIRGIMKEGFSASSIPKIQSLVQDKMRKMQELGNKVWDKGMEQAKPYLDKSPKVKELVEKNASDLKKGNVNELYGKIKDAVQSGSTGELEKYIKSVGEKAKQAGGSGGGGDGLESYLQMIPGGKEILPKLSQLQQIAQENGEEAEKIAKSTYEEIQAVLQRKVGEAQELAKKASKKSQ